MAVFTANNLYPGTIDTAMPGFLISSGSVKVYFDISPYNDINDIKEGYIQVSLRYQSNNYNALTDPSGIVLKTSAIDSNGRYFTITNSDLEKGAFLPFIYYKLQFRLTDVEASDKTPQQTIDSWLSADSSRAGKTNLDESSE